jgi:5'-nucleotidase (lipoprotein e(P4) family)
MRTKNLLTLFAISTLLLSSCSSSRPTTQSNGSTNCNTSESAILWQQTAAEYEALCHQAFNSGLFWIERQATDEISQGKPLAVIMDIDETVLDNSPYNARLIEENSSYDYESWYNWSKQSSAKLIPGVKNFIESLREINIEVFFISNRSIEELEFTIENFRKESLAVEEDHFLLRSDDKSKINRRQQVFDTHEVIMLVGDNLADFNENFDQENFTVSSRKEIINEFREEFGKKFIILPNVMYGDWESALEEEDPNYPNSDKFKGKKSFLRTY